MVKQQKHWGSTLLRNTARRRVGTSVTATELPGDARAAAAARSHLRAALAEWAAQDGRGAIDEALIGDAVLLVSELVTNAVVHTGTPVDVSCRLDPGPAEGKPSALVVEVCDRHPSRTVSAAPAVGVGAGRGLRLVGALAESWGVTYRGQYKIVWFRLPFRQAAAPLPGQGTTAPDPVLPDALPGAGLPAAAAGAPAPDQTVPDQTVPGLGTPESAVAGLATSGLPVPETAACEAAGPQWNAEEVFSFLAETSELLTGETDEERVLALAAQLAVPRLADWCAFWWDGEPGEPPRLARVWHSSEGRIEELRSLLLPMPPEPGSDLRGTAVAWPWPGGSAAYGPGGAAVACRLTSGDQAVGTLLVGRAGLLRLPGEALGLIEDFARRVAHAVICARRYTRQATISRVLQRGLLPSDVARIPGVETAVVYEPAGEEAWAGGDFYDVFEVGRGRWCFALGDVCGSGPEAAVVTGIARPVLRALARADHDVTAVLERLNREMSEQTRFLSLLYGELEPTGTGTVRCTLASAGHPLPLVLDAYGGVREAAGPQLLLGVVEDTTYECESFELDIGSTLLCVTDGVTEHRSGERMFDDGDGLAAVLAGCTGLDAAAVAQRIRQAVHAFGASPPSDDLAMLVVRPTGRAGDG